MHKRCFRAPLSVISDSDIPCASRWPVAHPSDPLTPRSAHTLFGSALYTEVDPIALCTSSLSKADHLVDELARLLASASRAGFR